MLISYPLAPFKQVVTFTVVMGCVGFLPPCHFPPPPQLGSVLLVAAKTEIGDSCCYSWIINSKYDGCHLASRT